MEAQARRLMAQLPYMRRYGRALTGSTSRGDDLVTRAMEDALGDPVTFRLDADEEVATRRRLYALLNTLFDAPTGGAGGKTAATEAGHPMEAALGTLPELERRVFLLVSLEELPTSQAADVLDLPVEQIREALGRAQNAMREQLVANILIVEDDAIIAYDLTETVLAMGHKVCGTAATMEEALAAAAANQPSLALMDLRLAHGGSGITTAQALRESRALPIIFVTAFAEELKQRGLDYLGPVIKKPFTREQIERAITQAVFTPRPGDAPPTLAGRTVG
ncbi:regulator [Skermanella stibiiresistens SB22]|uniref:Regulator n=2 Tax=Skermanella TaxID=204447 RepID=W9H5Y3_9PROT|nr:regulator [Skermanella stibiiresistens SB22]